jgi:hypothetical protein
MQCRSPGPAIDSFSAPSPVSKVPFGENPGEALVGCRPGHRTASCMLGHRCGQSCRVLPPRRCGLAQGSPASGISVGTPQAPVSLLVPVRHGRRLGLLLRRNDCQVCHSTLSDTPDQVSIGDDQRTACGVSTEMDTLPGGGVTVRSPGWVVDEMVWWTGSCAPLRGTGRTWEVQCT